MITLQDARRVIAAAEKKAAEMIGQLQNIAVVDAASGKPSKRHLRSESNHNAGWRHPIDYGDESLRGIRSGS